MPKFKPHSGMKKRVKITGSGKVSRRQANRHHGNERFTSKRLRRLKGDEPVSPADEKRIKRMLGI